MLSSRTSSRVAGILLLPAALLASAHAASPTDAGTPVPAIRYRSAFDGYQSFRDETLRSWAEANAAVAAGGSTHQHGTGPTTPTSSSPGHDHGAAAPKDGAAGKPMALDHHEMMMRHHETMKQKGMNHGDMRHGDMKHGAMSDKPMDHGGMK